MRNKKKFIALAAFLVALACLVHGPLKNNLGLSARYFYDHVDLGIYAQRASWYGAGLRPYTDVFSEYPQAATYFFAIPSVLLRAVSRPYVEADYEFVFSLLMVGLLFATTTLLHGLRSDNKNRAFLMLLPATIYFTINRYDMLPACLAVLSYAALTRGRYRWAGHLLALGVLAKWYLLLLFPIYAQYCYRKVHRLPWRMALVFVLTGLAGIATTVVHSGWSGVMVPYAFHSGRHPNSESLFYLLEQAVKFVSSVDIANRGYYLLFLGLQFAVMPLTLLFKIDTDEKVVTWSAFSILLFMLFGKFYSPQWIIWAMPFLILSCRDRATLALIAAFDVATYAYFPVIFDALRTTHPVPFPMAICIKTGLLLALIAKLAGQIGGDTITHLEPVASSLRSAS